MLYIKGNVKKITINGEVKEYSYRTYCDDEEMHKFLSTVELSTDSKDYKYLHLSKICGCPLFETSNYNLPHNMTLTNADGTVTVYCEYFDIIETIN